MSVTGVSGSGPRGRGRPRSFDPDEVADAALVLFWRQGFAATKLDQVTALTGVHGPSLSAAYSNKRGLFLAALERYRAHVGARLAVMADGDQGIDDVIGFLGLLRDDHTQGDRPPGCLMVNTMVEMGMGDPGIAAVVLAYRTDLAGAFRAALTRAARHGEIRRATVDARVRTLEAGCLGALVIGRVGAPGDLGKALDALTVQVRDWS